MADMKRLILLITASIGICILIIIYLYNSRPNLIHSLSNQFFTSNNNNNNNNDNMTNLLSDDTSDDTMRKRFPKAIIIGVRKGGTKALISMLDIHPFIIAAKGEIHYFDRQRNYAKGVKWYINRMPITKSNQIGIEKSPSYFIVPEVPKRIRDASQSVKLILIVRHPVTRTISDYTQLDLKKARRAQVRPSFEKSILKSDGSFKLAKGIIKVSLYDVHFERWLNYFKLGDILIVNGDQLITDPFSVVQKVENFLQVPTYFTQDMFYFNSSKGFYCWRKESGAPYCLGKSKGHKHPNVSEETVTKMTSFFRPHMIKFCKMAKVSFSWCKL